MTLFRTAGAALAQLVYPRLCEACQRPLLAAEQVLCLECTLLLPQTNYHHIAENDTALKLAGRFAFRNASSFAWFTKEGLLQHLLHRLKYESRKEIGYFLGARLGAALLQANWIKEIEVIVPVPLHRKKQQLRGGNQSYWIAEGISKVLAVPVNTGGLVRIKHTVSQTRGSREQRLENISGAFTIAQAGPLEGKHVLLVDDVLTTGATLEACAQALLTIRDCSLSIATVGIAGS
jgi:ComF family protein